MKKSNMGYAAPIGGALSTFWFIWSYFILAYETVHFSSLYGLYTAFIVGWYYFIVFPILSKEAEEREKRRRETFEQHVNAEVEKRLRIIREEEWKKNEAERRLKQQKEEEERKRKELELKWRKEYEQKLKEEFRLTQTVTDVTDKAFGDFV